MLLSAHADRVTALRALQVALTDYPPLACALVEADGYPALSVSRVDGHGSRTIRCAYLRDTGDWWFTGTDRHDLPTWIARTRDPRNAARVVALDLLKEPKA
ncbi:hypothetical protein SMC26_40155 [Actinomadura fulvescens]|uniref:hypothetical protein n=1 Tax=Actinomadura fulvescens TaxID=46160 RepID=UPI0031E1EA22